MNTDIYALSLCVFVFTVQYINDIYNKLVNFLCLFIFSHWKLRRKHLKHLKQISLENPSKFGIYFLNRWVQHNLLFNTVFFKSFNSTIVWLFIWRRFNYDYELWFDFEMHKQTGDKLKEQTELKSGQTFKCWAQRHWTVWWGIWWFKSDPSDLWSQIFLW